LAADRKASKPQLLCAPDFAVRPEFPLAMVGVQGGVTGGQAIAPAKKQDARMR